MVKKEAPNFLQITWVLEIQDLEEEIKIYQAQINHLKGLGFASVEWTTEHVLEPMLSLKKRRLEALLALEEAMQKNYFLKDLREDVAKLYKSESPIIEILMAKYYDWNPKGPKPKEKQ